MINPELNVGDKVVILEMYGETSVFYGDEGVVVGISVVFGNKQYKVKWKNGSTLDLLEDADRWIKEEDFQRLKKKKKIKENYVVTKKQLMSNLRLL